MATSLGPRPAWILACMVFTSHAAAQSDSIREFVKDAAWCWFQDERAVVDTVRQKLVIGSTNAKASVDVTIYDLASGTIESKKTFAKLDGPDDHNAPGLLVGPDGRYLAMWAHHYDKYATHYSLHDGSQWSAEKAFDWSGIPGGTNYTIAYSNVYFLSSLRRMFVFARANERAPNFLYSDDSGRTWTFGGQLTTNGSSTYNKGYYKYWSNGVDRIDMVFTEQHPRDTTTSIYHGYIQGGKTYATDGTLADADIYERASIPTFKAFTKVFADSTQLGGVLLRRAWQSDLVRHPDGTIAILFEARADNAIADHRNLYARWDGTRWTTTYLGKAGGPMYASEEDYTGLGALSPDDPDHIYLSSPYDPGNDASVAGKREIWRGQTTDHGATWTWKAVTAKSTLDNFRPIVPKWSPGKEALLWFRGTYTSAQNFSTNVVGILSDGDPRTSGVPPRRAPRSVELSLLGGFSRSGILRVRASVSRPSPISVQLFTAAGTSVTGVFREIASPGAASTAFRIGALPVGLYLCQIRSGAASVVVPVSVVP